MQQFKECINGRETTLQLHTGFCLSASLTDFILTVDAEHSAENGWELRVTGSQTDSAWGFIYSIRLIQSQADGNLFESRIRHGEMQLWK